MIEETSKDVYLAVNWVVRDAVLWTVRHAVRDIVEGAVGGVVRDTVDIAVYDPKHPALQEFLHSCGTEVGTQ